MIDTADLDHLDAQQLREMVLSLRRGAAADKLEIARRDHEIAFKQAAIDKLTLSTPEYFSPIPPE